MSAPDDAASLIGKARRGRIVWTSGVGAVAAAGAATLVFGAPRWRRSSPATRRWQPAGPASESALTTTVDLGGAFGHADALRGTVPEPSTSESTAPPATSGATGPAGVIDLSGGVTGGDDDDAYEDDHGDDRRGRRDATKTTGGPRGRRGPRRPRRRLIVLPGGRAAASRLHRARPTSHRIGPRAVASFCGSDGDSVWGIAPARVELSLGSARNHWGMV